MKWLFILIFLIVEILLFMLFFYLFNYIEPFKKNFLLSFFAITPAILLIGYILYNFIIEPKVAQDRVLNHLIRETIHEINLPISTIEANVKMLEKNEENSKNIVKLGRIKEAINRLKRLYSQLNYNIKKEIMPIEQERVLLDELVKERVSVFKDFNRNLFNVELNELELLIDKIGLEQVIDNILENAMKYSSKDKAIDIVIKDSKLIIKDRGIGIGEDELSLIYQRYYQESEANRGEGIGLSIVKRYCDSNNIELKIESKKGEGTIVILDFKLKKINI